jgi:hypothetical protein
LLVDLKLRVTSTIKLDNLESTNVVHVYIQHTHRTSHSVPGKE